MKKILLSCLLLLALGLILTGCSSTTEETTTETEVVSTEDLATEIIGTWNNTSEENGTGTISFTYTFEEDGNYELVIEDSFPESEESTNMKTTGSNIAGTYTLDGDELTLDMNMNAQDVTDLDDTNNTASDQTSEEALAEEALLAPETYTISISGNQLTMTDSSGDSTVYTRTK